MLCNADDAMIQILVTVTSGMLQGSTDPVLEKFRNQIPNANSKQIRTGSRGRNPLPAQTQNKTGKGDKNPNPNIDLVLPTWGPAVL